GLELIERGVIGSGADRWWWRVRVLIDCLAAHFDRVDGMRLRPRSFVGNGGVEGGEIDHPHWLRAEHERIEPNAVAINLGRHCRCTDVIEALFRVRFDAAVEQ